MQDHIHTERARFLRAAGSVDGEVAVEARLFGKAQHLAVALAEDDAVVLAHIGNGVNDVFHFALCHKARRAVGAFVGILKVPLFVISAAFAIAHAHHHKDQHGKRADADAEAVQPGRKAKHRAQA